MRRKTRQQPKEKKTQNIPYLILIIICMGVLLIVAVRQFTSSLFFSVKDRINVLVYGKKTVLFSLGIKDGVNYFISFSPDVKVKVPGGYGNYRVGGLAYLVSKEKNPALFVRAFSAITASTLDRYFYEPTSSIYYGKDEVELSALDLPGLRQLFFMGSNSNIFDRLYLVYHLAAKRKNQFASIEYSSLAGEEEEVFEDKDFGKTYQGYFYNRVFRDEKKTVQIIYPEDISGTKTYKTALSISNIIEGDGVRVVDLTESMHPSDKQECRIVESGNVQFSQSAKHLSAFFGCRLNSGPTESSDILLYINNLQKDWELL